MSYDKKTDEEIDDFPIQNIDKGAVIQERRLFNETPLNNRKCCMLLTKILFLLSNGETLSSQEATNFFFAATKLFQSNDTVVRRMMYLVLKELIPMSEDVIIVTSSLTNDMNTGPSEIVRANAIRVLTRVITDLALLGQGERYLKQAIVDREPYVSSSALVSGYHLTRNASNIDIVKKWFNEIQEAAKSKHVMVQYHALGFLYKIRQTDRLAVSKIVNSMIKNSIRSPFANCLLIRMVKEVLQDEPGNKALLEFLDTSLKHKSSMVNLEAAQAICSLPNMSVKSLIPAISQLQVLLCATRTAKRFAAIRCLNKVAMTHPAAVTVCNPDIESLIGGNRSIATLAITTLLKTGNESGVEKLMKLIQGFMNEISDEFRANVVDAIRTLCLKYPKKYQIMLSFLSSSLRGEGGLSFKTAVIDSIFSIVKQVPEAKDVALNYLCEFIEDCEFTQLCVRVLYELGEEGPTSENPSRYIRYIYNRVLLEPSIIRASAVSALAKFGRRVDSLRPRVITILKRCLVDEDDEVRDKAVFHLQLLEKFPQQSQRLLESDFPYPLINLETALKEYRRHPSAQPFDLSTVSIELPKELQKAKNNPSAGSAASSASSSSSAAGSAGSAAAEGKATSFGEVLAQALEPDDLGRLFRSSQPVELTESETEYTVSCIKHIFPGHVVFQFNCTNTLNDQLLEKVSVKMQTSSKDFKVVREIACKSALGSNDSGICYVVVAFRKGALPSATFKCSLRFFVKEIDGSGEASEEAFEDEYQLEDVEIKTNDYMLKVLISDFKKAWDEMAGEVATELYGLSAKSMEEAVKSVTEMLGMAPCEGTDQPANKQRHILFLAGVLHGNHKVLVRIRMKAEGTTGVNIEVACQTADADISRMIAEAIQ